MNKDKDDDTKARDKNRANPTGSVVAEDDELTRWLNRLWARNEPPERVEVWQMFGRNRAERGEMIFHEDFRVGGDKLNIEQANRLANEIMEAAQNDCDCTPGGRAMSYEIVIIDRNRKAQPLVRRIGPLRPKRTYAVTKVGDNGSGEGDEDDENINAHNVQLKYLQEGMGQLRWEKNRTDHVIGEMLVLQNNIIQKQQSVIDQFFDKLIVSFEKRQESEDRSLDRELAREKGRFMLNMWQDGVSTAKNLLPGFFGGNNGGSNGATNGTNGANGHNEKPSPERLLVTNFLTDVGRKPDLETALFGNFEVQEQEDGSKRMVQTVPGIFKFEQFRLLIGVREGKLPDETLLELLPDSEHTNAVTEDQVNKALAAGMPLGIGMAIQELFKLLKDRRDSVEEEHPAE